jgi:hypothetical protein
MNEDEQKQLLQKKIFDNPSLYISTHVKIDLFRLNAKFAINILNWNLPIITQGYTFNRKKEFLRFCKEMSIQTQPQSLDFRYMFISSFPLLNF